MKNIIFRSDSSKKLGSGHHIRCLNLARSLKINNFNIYFICQELEDNINEKIRREFPLLTFTTDNYLYNEFDEMSLANKESSGNKNKQFHDYLRTVDLLKKNNLFNIDMIIIDNYSLDAFYTNLIIKHFNNKKNCFSKVPKFLVIDDLLNRKLNGNILINQTIFDTLSFESNPLVKSFDKCFLGPKYVLLDLKYKKLHLKSKLRFKIKTLLIYFGGSDIFGYTYKLLSIIKSQEFNKKINVKVVISQKSKYFNETKLLGSSMVNTKILFDLPSLSELINNSDFFIGSGGMITWERITLKLAGIVIPTAENQIKVSKYLESLGLIKLFSSLEEIKLNISLFEDYLNLFNKNLKKYGINCDGKGIDRVIKIIKENIE